MSFEPPDGILDIGNATLRVGKLEVAETSGLNQGLLNIVKNNLLITENTEYASSNTWGIKLPTTWVAEFEVKGHSGKYIDFNFYNENSASNAQGYNLTFMDTSLTLRYDGGDPLGGGVATIPTIVDTYRKVNIFFERNVIAVSIDGTRVLYDKRPSVLSRVISTTGSAFVNVFIEQNASNSAFKNLRIVNGRFISDKTSNIAFIGGNLGVGVNSPTESLDVLGNIKASGNVHVTGNVHAGGEIELYSNLNIQQVSNTATIKATSNVVTEFPRSKKLIKYPRVLLTSETSGGYIVTSSEEISGGNSAAWQNWKPFGGFFPANNHAWLTGIGSYPSTAGAASTSGTTEGDALPQNLGTDSGGSATANGSWLKLQLPHKITLEYIRMNGDNVVAPDDFDVLGSNDDTNWNILGSFTTPNPSLYNRMDQFDISATTSYLYYAVIIKSHRGTTHSYSGIYNLEYYGVPEYDPDAHGTDVVVKSVPNVPNTDWLEVYYDAKNYTSGVVQDLSTNSFNGTLTNGASFNNSDGIDKFVFDAGLNQYMTTTTDISGVDFTHTTSMWVKFVEVGTDSNDQHYLFMLGAFGSNSIGMYYSSNQGIRVAPSGFDYRTQYHPIAGRWFHVSYTYAGGAHGTAAMNTTVKFYINGQQWHIPAYYGNTSTVTLPSSSVLQINGSAGNNNTIMDMEVANFRLFNRALTSDEIYQLYAYQKEYFGHGDLSMTLKAGRLGIGTSSMNFPA
jgi:hypothetical protein